MGFSQNGLDLSYSPENKDLYLQMKNSDKVFSGHTIIGKFCDQVSKYPSRVALSSQNRRLAYEELNQYANGMALELVNTGVKKGDFVGVFINRSIEAVIGLLGILKIGAVYVPIDPNYPPERIEYMISDTNCSVIITNSEARTKLPILKNNPAIIDVNRIDRVQENILCKELLPEDIAYVIYTSGSTGMPKGTLLKHVGVPNLVEWIADHYHFHAHTVIAEFASFSFDASISDIFQALLNGVQLHLFSEEARMDHKILLEEVHEHKVTNMVLPTAFFNSMVPMITENEKEKLSSLEVFAVAGEALTGEMVRIWQEKFGLTPMLSNFYGPTEATVMASYYDLDFQLPKNVANVPIGIPIQNVKLYVVNEKGQLCQPNEPGELIIEGPGISIGYHNQPEKTEAVFIKQNETCFLYKTGDIVKLLPEGTIEFVGRKDDQVKIRGHRVEIGEIENFLQGLDYVHEVAVVARANNGIKELYGFYKLKENVDVPKQLLENEMKKVLPDYMIPAYLIKLEEMPIAPTGKIDRKKLENIDIQPFFMQDIVGPRNETEEILVRELGKEFLLEKFDVREDIFTIGASSLKILNALAKLKPHFPMLSIQDFYKNRTVENLAQYINATKKSEKKQAIQIAQSLKEHPIYIGPKNEYSSSKLEKGTEQILLTGSTGFLGIHILLDLLKETNANIVCLVRGKSEIEARTRLLDSLFYFANEQLDTTRIQIIVGDLGTEQLGLSQEMHTKLANSLDRIIHSAADVRHFGDEEHFHNVNVKGTQRLLDLAYHNKHIQFTYISTIGIPEGLAEEGLWDDYCEMLPSEFSSSLNNVYTNSKFEAEKLIHQAMEDGIQASVFRIGNLTGQSTSGVFQKNIDSNAFYRMIKGLILLGKIKKSEAIVDLTPVDIASRAIIDISFNAQSYGKTFHIVDPNPMKFNEFMQSLKKLGYFIEQVNKEDFSDWIFKADLPQESKQLAISIIEGEGLKESLWEWDCEQTRLFVRSYDSSFTHRDEYIKSIIKHGQEVGYFPLPSLVLA
ncbi:amino acid adenylation domain-containing protein [Bacillus sp. FJAT-49705]|uniref:Amino acid adenylation domain-containing protein n=1 Tax=Cytobacillus citreus TaxID=2833586 RepID=A0ABS5NRW0_9BACI|nr:non-ribosomal peptide synthetase [Cytobacillus citreus]MBS4190545.1 amino acid adenylation domain-containing protein [Cytobacillus citreus]